MYQNYQKEDRYELTYISKKTGEVKKCFPRSKEKKEEQLTVCKEQGIKVVSCKKLYPFNMMKNQHNFELISNICFCRMHDMEIGEIQFDGTEYDKMYDMKEKADRFFCWLQGPIAWLTWEDWKDAKELSEMAIIHRQNACIEAGRPDLVTYC